LKPAADILGTAGKSHGASLQVRTEEKIKMKENRLTKVFNSVAREFKNNLEADGATVTAVTVIGWALTPVTTPVLIAGSVLSVGAYRLAKGTYKGFKKDR
jgi:hypothetical protein